ncbi:MAG: hypothetical protein JRI25_03355 [Deltaproteobacteria bacterium]|nr:hypothetical protein [Deltaproteobacteria bacterium]
MQFDPQMVWTALAAAVSVLLLVWVVRRWGQSLRHGGRVDRAVWEMYAAERDFSYTADPRHPRIRGVHDGVSIEASARIVRQRTRRGVQEFATTILSATHRADLPSGFLTRKRNWYMDIGARVFGGKRVSVDEDMDAFFRVECRDATRAAELLTDSEVKKAMLALLVDLPEAIVHDRAVEAKLPGMVSDLSVLDQYLDRMTAVARALRALAPQVDLASPEEVKPMVTAAELPQRRETLTSALQRIGGASSKTSAMVQTSALRIKPYEYELEVRSVIEAASRLGVPTGGLLVRGLLARSPWRAEISFKPEDNEAVSELKMSDFITGIALVDEVRAPSRVVECSAVTPPMLLKAAPHPPSPDAHSPRGTGGDSPT